MENYEKNLDEGTKEAVAENEWNKRQVFIYNKNTNDYFDNSTFSNN